LAKAASLEILHLEQTELAGYQSLHEYGFEQQSLVVGSLLGGLDHACALEINKPPGTSRSGGFLFDPPDLDHRDGSNGAWK
jgi:hypothetical protein